MHLPVPTMPVITPVEWTQIEKTAVYTEFSKTKYGSVTLSDVVSRYRDAMATKEAYYSIKYLYYLLCLHLSVPKKNRIRVAEYEQANLGEDDFSVTVTTANDLLIVYGVSIFNGDDASATGLYTNVEDLQSGSSESYNMNGITGLAANSNHRYEAIYSDGPVNFPLILDGGSKLHINLSQTSDSAKHKIRVLYQKVIGSISITSA